jgi:hypothetical protein
MLSSGCAIYRASSPDHPSKIVWTKPPGSDVYRVGKIRGSIFSSRGGKASVTPEELNGTLADWWPERFSSEEGSIALTVRLEGKLPGFGPNHLGHSYGDLGTSMCALLVLGVDRRESRGEVSAEVLVGDAIWSSPGKAQATELCLMCCQPLLFPVAYPLLRAFPPHGSDWPEDTHFGSISYSNPEREQRMAVDLAASAVAKAVQRLSPDELAAIRGSSLLTGRELSARKRLDEGSTTRAVKSEATDGSVEFAETRHEFEADASVGSRFVPRIVEQRYDPATRRGLVEADLSECDPEKGYEYLTRRLIPAICETKNVVLSVDDPPPAHAEYRLLNERKNPNNGHQIIEFEALQ